MSRFFIHTKTLSYPTRLHKITGSPEPSLITFVINTSRYGFIMLGSSDLKKDAWVYLWHRKTRKVQWSQTRRTLCARARGCVHVFDFCHDWTKYLRDLHQSDVHWTYRLPLNKSLACINAGCTRISDTDDRTDRRNAPVPLICLLTDVLDEKRKHSRQTH